MIRMMQMMRLAMQPTKEVLVSIFGPSLLLGVEALIAHTIPVPIIISTRTTTSERVMLVWAAG